MNKENVNQSDKPKKTMKKVITAILLVFTLIIGSFVVPVTSEGGNLTVTVVEAAAKKDKKKPVIKFSGKSKITVEKNEVVKILKTTAKDNKDGNVTQKIGVTVKKGKKSYNSIAKKIKKNKKVKFPSVGKYTITYTVKDKAGNKATKKRYVTVVDSKKNTTETTTATDAPTTQEKTTEATTEKSTTEQPKVEKEYTINKVKVGDKIYNIIDDESFASEIQIIPQTSDKITLTIENYYSSLSFSRDSGLLENYGYLKVLGELNAVDQNGKDISEDITIYAPTKNSEKTHYNIYVFVEDTTGNSIKIPITLFMYEFSDDIDYDENTFGKNYDLLSKDPLIYGYVYRNNSTNSYSFAKKFEYTVE